MRISGTTTIARFDLDSLLVLDFSSPTPTLGLIVPMPVLLPLAFHFVTAGLVGLVAFAQLRSRKR